MTIELNAAEVELLVEALDSHERWQLSDPCWRSSGYVILPGEDVQPSTVEPLDRDQREAVRRSSKPAGSLSGSRLQFDVDDVSDAQRLDLALLLSLVDDPIELAGQLTKRDRQRLRARPEMADVDQRAWSSLSVDRADRGRAAFRLLAG